MMKLAVIRNNLNFINLTINAQRYFSSDFRNYSVSEVKIPVPGGLIAGKLWEPNNNQVSSKTLPIIAVHGWLDNAGSFDNLLPLLMTSTKFFAFDLPGHGFTTYAPLWFYDGHVDGIISIQRVMKHFGWDRVNYIGHSMGGIIGFIFASLFPQQINKFVALENMRPLIHNSLLSSMTSAINLVFEVEERVKAVRKSYPLDNLVKHFYDGRQQQISLEGCRTLLKRGAVPVDENRYTYSYNFRTLIPGQEGRFTGELCEEFASQMRASTCFIKAEPGNTYVTEEDIHKFFKVLEKSLEHFEQHSCPGSHHFHLDNPQPVAAIIKKFLDLR